MQMSVLLQFGKCYNFFKNYFNVFASKKKIQHISQAYDENYALLMCAQCVGHPRGFLTHEPNT